MILLTQIAATVILLVGLVIVIEWTGALRSYPLLFAKGQRVPWWLLCAIPNLRGWPRYSGARFGTEGSVWRRPEGGYEFVGAPEADEHLVDIPVAHNVDIYGGIGTAGMCWRSVRADKRAVAIHLGLPTT